MTSIRVLHLSKHWGDVRALDDVSFDVPKGSLTVLLERRPSQLSGGQQQRVAMGRAIIAESPVCLMDEPMSNLDAKLRNEMRAERTVRTEVGESVRLSWPPDALHLFDGKTGRRLTPATARTPETCA